MEIIREQFYSVGIAIPEVDSTEFEEIIIELGKFPNLKFIDLSECNVPQIPISLSEIKNVEAINLVGNHVENIEDLISIFKSLPNLKHIWLDLDYGSNLSSKYLNEIESIPGLYSVNGDYLPDCEDIGAEHLENLTNSMVENEEEEEEFEEEYEEDNQSDTEMTEEIKTLKDLILLGKEVFDVDEFENDSTDSVSLLHEILYLRKDKSQELRQDGFNTFEQKAQTINEQYQKIKTDLELDEERNPEMAMFDKLVERFEGLIVGNSFYTIDMEILCDILADSNEDLAEYFRKILRIQHSNVLKMRQLMCYSRFEHESIVKSLKGKLDHMAHDQDQLFDVDKDLTQKTEEMSDRVKELERHIIELDKQHENEVDQLKKQVILLQQKLNKEKRRYHEHKTIMSSQDATYLTSNDHEQTISSSVTITTPLKSNKKKGLQAYHNERKTQANSYGYTNKNKRHYAKTLTKRQTLDLIKEIYESKAEADEKAKRSQKPLLTMNRHLQDFFTAKYGLPFIIKQNLQALNGAIEKFRSESSDVAVFEQIRLNQIDEDFKDVQDQLKITVEQLLRVYITEDNPMALNVDIDKLLSESLSVIKERYWMRIIKDIYDDEHAIELINLVNVLVSEYWSERISQATGEQQHNVRRDYLSESQKIRSKHLQKVGKLNNVMAKMGLLPEEEKTKVPFVKFMEILLNWQLKQHYEYLAKFRELFYSVDQNNHGVLDVNQFDQLLRLIDNELSDHDVAYLINEADKDGTDSFTFSQAVKFCSGYVKNVGNL
eukprot:TRINITY_DN3121_c5_g2_i1.p1 TRINITY_DN3121_c5_g2~~TRINITY_DN3121_c5_g2_i1.p1  ORF type:complete len:773 (-),score=262.28 TRINITY_DN3121_c5_g2_i1:19-2337(-)